MKFEKNSKDKSTSDKISGVSKKLTRRKKRLINKVKQVS